ncbi:MULTISPECIES: hypothetical protein [unclassified Streptomyces]|uniref:hypothetical protein n=1 Tax=unclassified Streptomyces TaxID=2593676 RepID=UPI00131E595C|nr:hypothetical protein [Streptomyces sp. CB01635]
MLIMRWQGEEVFAARQGMLGFNFCAEAGVAGAGVALEHLDAKVAVPDDVGCSIAAVDGTWSSEDFSFYVVGDDPPQCVRQPARRGPVPDHRQGRLRPRSDTARPRRP